jgi:hypothetical protein
MPVFLDLRYNLNRYNHSYFIFANAGYSFLLSTKHFSDSFHYTDSTYTQTTLINFQYNNGVYYCIGIGYKLNFKRNLAWTISLGFDYYGTTISYTEYQTYIYPSNPIFNSSYSGRYSYRIDNRLTLRTGFNF